MTEEATLFCLDLGMAIGRLLVDAEELDPAPVSTSTSIEAVREMKKKKKEENGVNSGSSNGRRRKREIDTGFITRSDITTGIVATESPHKAGWDGRVLVETA